MSLRSGSALAMFLLLVVMQTEGFGQPRRRFGYSRPVQTMRATYHVGSTATPAVAEATATSVPATLVSMQEPTPASEASGGTPLTSSCGCGGGSPGTGPCIRSPNCRYTITPWAGRPTVTSKPITVTIPTDCGPPTTVNTPFYKVSHDGEGTIKLPRKTINIKEIFRFKSVTYTLCGCTISVCVPCAIDCECIEKCVPTPTVVKLQARVRTEPVNGADVADIWAVGVNGLPSEAVLALAVSATSANTQFGTNFSY